MLHTRQKNGFSLVEVVVAMAAFTIIIMGTIQIMAQGSKNYRTTKNLQTNLEASQFALNLMAKELRSSSIIASTATSVQFYDYSQNRCISYGVSGGLLRRGSREFSDPDPNISRQDCVAGGAGAPSVVATDITGVFFQVDPSTSSPPHVGRVTVGFTVGTGSAASTVQTTVSLRDFNYIGL